MEATPLSYQIFVVEDHPVMREAYVAAIGIEPDFTLCGSAASAEEALEHFDGESPCDLVITDLRLPGMSGVDLVERLHLARPALPILVISAHEEDFHVRRALDAGAAGFLSKRTLAATLAGAIRSAVMGDGAGTRA